MKQSVDPGDEVVPGSQGSGVEGGGGKGENDQEM